MVTKKTNEPLSFSLPPNFDGSFETRLFRIIQKLERAEVEHDLSPSIGELLNLEKLDDKTSRKLSLISEYFAASPWIVFLAIAHLLGEEDEVGLPPQLVEMRRLRQLGHPFDMAPSEQAELDARRSELLEILTAAVAQAGSSTKHQSPGTKRESISELFNLTREDWLFANIVSLANEARERANSLDETFAFVRETCANMRRKRVVG